MSVQMSGPTASTPTHRPLQRGCTGDDVRAVQDVLNFHLRGLMPLVVDGIFGDRAESRVRFFQRVNGLKEDGIVGPLTRDALFETTIASFRLLFIPRTLLSAAPPTALPTQLPTQLPPRQPAQGAPTQPLPPQFAGGSRDLRKVSPRLSPAPQFGPDVTVPESQTLKLPILPALHSPAAPVAITPSVLRFKLAVPTRKDPTDPQVRCRQEAIELIDTSSIDAATRGFLIDQVPDPEEEKKVQPPDAAFKWGADPIFIPPYSTTLSAGKARFTLKLSGGGPTTHPELLVGAWGEGRALINIAEKEFETRTLSRAQLESVGMVGVMSTF